MGEITAANMKMYQCTTWTEGATHGGAINTSVEIASSGDQIIFDDVTDAQRISGVTEYRKIYFRNENADSINIKCWINTAYAAANEVISIVKAVSTSDVQTDADDYTYVTPNAIGHADVLDLGALAQNASAGVWIKRVVSAGGNGYAVDTMALGFGMY
jgi:hypothetical protein